MLLTTKARERNLPLILNKFFYCRFSIVKVNNFSKFFFYIDWIGDWINPLLSLPYHVIASTSHSLFIDIGLIGTACTEARIPCLLICRIGITISLHIPCFFHTKYNMYLFYKVWPAWSMCTTSMQPIFTQVFFIFVFLVDMCHVCEKHLNRLMIYTFSIVFSIFPSVLCQSNSSRGAWQLLGGMFKSQVIPDCAYC